MHSTPSNASQLRAIFSCAQVAQAFSTLTTLVSYHTPESVRAPRTGFQVKFRSRDMICDPTMRGVIVHDQVSDPFASPSACSCAESLTMVKLGAVRCASMLNKAGSGIGALDAGGVAGRKTATTL